MRISDFTSITEEQGKTFEAQAKQIVAVMPGGFHPFHPGHKSLYDWAVKTFGKDNVYVAATNDTATRPFPFEVKKQLAAMAGVPKDRVIQVKSPFNAMSYKDIVDDNTALVFVRSQKDKNEQPLPDQIKKNGEPGYLRTYTGKDLEPSNVAGYMAYGPTIDFDFSGMQIKSASELRNTWPNMADEDKLKAAKLMYGNGAEVAVKLLDQALGVKEPEVAEGMFGIDAKPMYDAVRSGMGIAESTYSQRMLKVIETLSDLNRINPFNQETNTYILEQVSIIKEHLNNIKEATLDLPDLETGDELMVGKFKNRKATIKDFKKDDHGQPVAVTNKGDQKIFKGRVKKLMPTEGKSPHKKGTEKYRKHMAAMHAGMNEAKKSGSYLLQLERDNDLLVLHIKNTKTGQRTEVRGKPGYELDGYDATDPLHQMLDKVGKAANISDLMNGDVVSINPNHPDGPRAREEFKQITNEGVSYADPQFDVEWEEANRYPYLEKLGTEGWEELAKTGRAVRVTTDSVKKIGNTGADGSESLDDLEPEKVARLKQAMDSGTVEMPIVVKQPDGSLELIAGNTRLIGLISTQGEAQVWLVDASTLTEGVGRIVKGVNTTPDVGVNQTKIEAAKLGSKVDKDGRPPVLERGSIGVPLSSGLTVNIAPHRELKIKKSTMGRHNYENPRTKKSRKS